MNWGELWRGYVPLLLTFIGAQLILQVDLAMLSRLGEHATAACIALLRIGLIDLILSMGVGAVASVVVSQAFRAGNVDAVVPQVLTVAALLGIATTGVGLLIYPRLVFWFIGSNEVSALVTGAIFWFALAAPFRLTGIAAIYAIHALGEGKSVVYWKLLEVGLKVLANWLLVFVLSLGFKGSYLATLLVSLLGCGWALNRLRQHAKVGFCMPKTAWVPDFLRQVGWEAQRLLSGQLFALLAFVLFASSWIAPLELPRLSAFSAATALMLFLFAPLAALLRTLAFQLAGASLPMMFSALKSLCWCGMPLLILVAAGLYFCGDHLGQIVYAQRDSRWWSMLVAVLAISLPLRYLNNLQRTLLQTRQEFAAVARAESFTTWLIGLPLIIIGLVLDSPLIACSHLVLPELGCTMWLTWRYVLPLYRMSRVGAPEPVLLVQQT
ncbi:MAG TPA: MATE family efflux transporter [Gallionella sp.]|nr:MATE family efflux transporter [Gallionella sp.]